MKLFNEKMKLLRTESNLKQSELANIFNVSQQTISQYENGSREPDVEYLKKFSNHFGVTVDYLIDDDLSVDYIIYDKYKGLTNDLNKQEQNLINIFRILPNSDKKKLIEIARIFFKLSENK